MFGSDEGGGGAGGGGDYGELAESSKIKMKCIFDRRKEEEGRSAGGGGALSKQITGEEMLDLPKITQEQREHIQTSETNT